MNSGRMRSPRVLSSQYKQPWFAEHFLLKMRGESAWKFPPVNNLERSAAAVPLLSTRGRQCSAPGKLPERGCGKIHALV